MQMTYEQERRARRSLLDRWHAARDRWVAAHRDEHEHTQVRDANPDVLAADPTAAHEHSAFARPDAGELESIVHALRRLRSGVYGRCIVCGASIPAVALEADPETVTCPSCASDRDAGTAVHP